MARDDGERKALLEGEPARIGGANANGITIARSAQNGCRFETWSCNRKERIVGITRSAHELVGEHVVTGIGIGSIEDPNIGGNSRSRKQLAIAQADIGGGKGIRGLWNRRNRQINVIVATTGTGGMLLPARNIVADRNRIGTKGSIEILVKHSPAAASREGDGPAGVVILPIIPLPEAQAIGFGADVNRVRSGNGEGIEAINGRGQLRADPGDLVRGVDEERDEVVISASATSPGKHRHLHDFDKVPHSGNGGRVDDRGFEHADSGPAIGTSSAGERAGLAFADYGGCARDGCSASQDGKRDEDGFYAHNLGEGVSIQSIRGLSPRLFWANIGGEGQRTEYAS